MDDTDDMMVSFDLDVDFVPSSYPGSPVEVLLMEGSDSEINEISNQMGINENEVKELSIDDKFEEMSINNPSDILMPPELFADSPFTELPTINQSDLDAIRQNPVNADVIPPDTVTSVSDHSDGEESDSDDESTPPCSQEGQGVLFGQLPFDELMLHIKNYLQSDPTNRHWPEGLTKNKKTELKRKCKKYFVKNNVLYRRHDCTDKTTNDKTGNYFLFS